MKWRNNIKIHEFGDAMESKSYAFVSRWMNHLLDSFFLFKKRKGDIVAGSATFFAILSFGPILLLMISLMGQFHGDVVEAKTHVLTSIQNNIPKLAPWIVESFSKIIDTQLKQKSGMNILNSFFLLYSVLGVVSSIMFGINTISQKKTRGGFYIEDFRSLVLGATTAVFVVGMLYLSHPPSLKKLIGINDPGLMNFLVDYQAIPMALSLLFFSFLYKSVIPLKVSIKDSLAGALTFVGCFMAGKSFYWVYHLYSKDGLSQAYGNFYTMVIATFWIYFLMSSFFYGACVASLRSQKQMAQKMNVDDENSVAKMVKNKNGEEPPPLKIISDTNKQTSKKAS